MAAHSANPGLVIDGEYPLRANPVVGNKNPTDPAAAATDRGRADAGTGDSVFPRACLCGVRLQYFADRKSVV